MTKTCVCCKKQHIPFDNTRSFHKFPNDVKLRGKWMQLTGQSVISKNSTVCSDHFEIHSFHQTDGYTTVRRLLSNAVPSIALNKKELYNSITGSNDTSQNENTSIDYSIEMLKNSDSSERLNNKSNDSTNISDAHARKSQQNDLKSSLDSGSVSKIRSFKYFNYSNEQDLNTRNTINTETCESNLLLNSASVEENCNDLSISSDVNSTFQEPLVTESTNYNVDSCTNNRQSNGNCKRKYPDHESKNCPKTKKFRFMNGVQYHCISRNDFVSDEAWNKFMKYTVYKNSQVAAARQKNWRREKKIANMKDLVNHLKENKASEAAEYLDVIYI